jgi:YfiH family protein
MTATVHLQVPGWERIAGLTHGFLGRIDPAVSAGETPASSSSTRSCDQTDLLCPAKKAVALEGRLITCVRQVHGDTILDVALPAPKIAGEGDALATDQRGVLLGIRTADCVPVLIVDPKRRVCAAVHAGWRGTLAGIAGKTVAHLRARYGCEPRDLHAALGPAIGRCCYEVGAEVIEAFRSAMGKRLDPFFDRRGEKGCLDLRGLNRLQLGDAGVSPDRTLAIGPCTACAVDRFYSYRKGGQTEGRQLSFVGWGQASSSSRSLASTE